MIVNLAVVTGVLVLTSLSGIHGGRDNGAYNAPVGVENADRDDYPVRGEIRKTYKVAPNANIVVSQIEGPVEVETTDSDTVELHFVREARSQRDYDCETISIEDSAASLVVRHHTDKSCRVIQARESLKMIVPRSANLDFRRLEGDFTVSATDGFLRLSHIEGKVRVGDVRAAEIGWVEGGLSLNVDEVTANGISVRNVEGAVDLGLTDKVNADISVTRHSGDVEILVPNIEVTAAGKKEYRLRVGSGGAQISLSGIDGGVKIRRL